MLFEIKQPSDYDEREKVEFGIRVFSDESIRFEMNDTGTKEYNHIDLPRKKIKEIRDFLNLVLKENGIIE